MISYISVQIAREMSPFLVISQLNIE